MTIQRIGLVTHLGRDTAREAAQAVKEWADRHNIPVSDVDVWHPDGEVRRHAREEVEAGGHPDLIVTVGGDGTFLRGARLAVQDNAAVVGVNAGRVGFLTDVEPAEIDGALSLLRGGGGYLEERLTLTMRASKPMHMPEDIGTMLRKGKRHPLPPPPPREPSTDGGWGLPLDVTAINDIVFEKLVRDRQIDLGVYLDGRLFASYSADALIVSSATGSTAYSFAAGGPVISPRLDALVFTPVAPHMIFDRSLVLAADEVVALRVVPGSGPVAISIDGQLRGALDEGDWIAVYASSRRLRMLRLRPPNFFGRLRSRFYLPDAPAAITESGLPERDGPDSPVPDDVAHLYRP